MENKGNHIHELISEFFRQESGKMTAVLVRMLGIRHIEIAQDIVQDSLLKAMNCWRYKGVPDNPTAWLYRVAKNKAIDYLRRQKKLEQINLDISLEKDVDSPTDTFFLSHEIADSQLRMIFACCHPSIPEESSVALVLKTLCGLNSREIAKAFLSSEDTVAKRIYRAKEKIRTEQIELEMPPPGEMPQRLDSVLKSIYLLFNEGYNSSHPEQLIRKDLCKEAIRLAFLLTENLTTKLPRTYALLALMHFQASRFDSRTNEEGEIILLQNQDRSTWNQELIKKGFELLESAAEPFETSTYHLEAAIASIHASAPNFAQTNWKAIHRLYELLFQIRPNPMVALNKAIALFYAGDKQLAIAEMKTIKGLENNHIFYASLGEVHAELGLKPQAKEFYEKALQHTISQPERALLHRKLALCV